MENQWAAKTSSTVHAPVSENPAPPEKGVKGQKEWRKRHSTALMLIGRSNPWIPAVLFVPSVAALIFYAATSGQISFAKGAILVLTGILGWTLLEYILHRFSFHTAADPAERTVNPVKWLNALSSGVHGLHHDQPKLPDLIVAPPVLSFPTAALYLGLLSWITGFTVAAVVVSGMISGYLFYEWVHYSTHCRRPRTWLGRYLTKYHMVHHFTDSQNYFGVTSPLWDVVFGTRPKSLKVK